MDVSRTSTRLFSGQMTLIAALLMAVAFAAGCSAESSLADIRCDDDSDCPDDAKCVDDYCVERVTDAALTVSIDGLPDGVDGEVTVVGPADFEQQLAESATLDELRPGDYEVSAEAVGDHERYAPEPTSTTVTIESEQTAGVDIEYALVHGQLTVSFEGLPEQLEGVAGVEGPDGFSEFAEGETVFDEVVPGTYDIVAQDIEEELAIYEGDTASVEVSSGDEEAATITYEVLTGTIAVEVSGFPEGTEPSIDVIDAQGESVAQVPEDGLVQDLVPGFYTVVPEPIEDGSTTYLASEVDAWVASNQTEPVALEYLADPGSLHVDVTGLPEGAEHAIEVVGEEQTIDLPQSGELAAIKAGTYTLEVGDVEVELATYEAEGQEVTIGSGELVEVDIDYDVIRAELTVEVTGIPDGVSAAIDVEGGELEDATVNPTTDTSAPLEELFPDHYTLTPNEVVVEGSTYRADPIEDIELASGDEETVTVEYDIVEAELQVTVTGLEGNSTTVEVRDESDDVVTTREIVDGQTISIDDLEPGTYSLVPPDVSDPPKTFRADSIEDIELESEALVEETIEYAYIPGALHVDADGLDGNILRATVTGPEFPNGTEINENDATVGPLEPGTYDVEFLQVDDDPNFYVPGEPSEFEFLVSSGDDAQDHQAFTTYELVDGAIQVTVEDLEGATGEVAIHDGSGERDRLTIDDGNTETSIDLEPGTYTLIPQDVDVSGTDPDWTRTYEAGEETVEVTSGEPVGETITYDFITGDLTVEASGLEGNDLNAEVQGPEFEQAEDVTDNPDLFNDLKPGAYTVTFDRVFDEQNPDNYYDPQSSTVEVGVSSGDSGTDTTASTTYELVDGAIEVTVEGLENETGVVEIHDESGERDTLTIDDGTTETSIDLEPGTYTLVPQDVDVSDTDPDWTRTYEAGEETVEVTSGEPVGETITYDFITGDLTVEASGLDGNDLDATVDGPEYGTGGRDITDNPTLLDDIKPGEYTVTFDRVFDEENPDNYYDPQPGQDRVGVSSGDQGDDTTATTSYDLVDGTLEVTVEGIDGETADVEVHHAEDGLVDTFFGLGDGETDDMELPPGTYRLEPQPVEGSPKDYEPTEETIEDLEVTSGDVTAQTVEYEVVPGHLRIDADGLDDAGLQLEATVDGPEYDTPITVNENDKLLEEIEPGEYTVDFLNVDRDVDGEDGYTEIYEPNPAQRVVTVESDSTTDAETTYELVTGSLSVHVEMPDEDLNGMDLQATFEIVDEGDVVQHSFDVTDGPTTEEAEELDPGYYQVRLHTDDDPLTDTWGNEFVFDGLDEDIAVSSDDDSEELEEIHQVTTRHPTEVWTENDSGEGSLRDIVGSVNDDSIVVFADDVQRIELNSGRVLIDKPLVIDGDGQDVVVAVEEGAADQRLFDIAPDAANVEEGDLISVQDLVVEGGREANGGGMIISPDDADVTLFGVTFRDNEADGGLGGGAVNIADFNATGTVHFEDVTFENNHANHADGSGGALYADDDADVVLRRVTFENNSAEDSGGALRTADADIDEAYFVGNEARDGGAIYVDAQATDFHIERSLFENNTARGTGDGGAIYAAGDAYIENSTFSSNTAVDGLGGALFFDGDGDADILHATMIGNEASDAHALRSDTDGIVQLGASYVADNGESGEEIQVDPDFLIAIGFSDPVVSLGHNFISRIEDEDNFDDEPSDETNEDAFFDEQLSDQGGFTEVHTIDAGEVGHLDIAADDCRKIGDDGTARDGAVMDGDQRRSPRPAGAGCSRGAWEVDAHVETFDNADFTATLSSGDFVGVDGITWDYNQVRDPGGDEIDGMGARFDDNTGNVSSSEAPVTDIESFSVQFRHAGTGGADRQIEVSVGGQLSETSAEIGDTGDEIHVLEIDDWSGVTQEDPLLIENLENNPVVIDNISWR